MTACLRPAPQPYLQGRRALTAVGSCFWITGPAVRCRLAAGPWGRGSRGTRPAKTAAEKNRLSGVQTGQGTGQGRQGARPRPLCRIGATRTAYSPPLAGAPTPIPAGKFEAPSTHVTASRCSGDASPRPCRHHTAGVSSPDAASGPSPAGAMGPADLNPVTAAPQAHLPPGGNHSSAPARRARARLPLGKPRLGEARVSFQDSPALPAPGTAEALTGCGPGAVVPALPFGTGKPFLAVWG